METTHTTYFEEKFHQLQSLQTDDFFKNIRREGFDAFSKAGLPTHRNEEWKYTSLQNVFKEKYHLLESQNVEEFAAFNLNQFRLPGCENANELVFINGKFVPELSILHSSKNQLTVLPLEEAIHSSYGEIIKEHLNKSTLFIKDGIHALNTSFIHNGVFIYVNKNAALQKPVYVYHFSNTTNYPVLSQPRSLVYIDENAQVQLTEVYKTIGAMDSFTNEVMEVVVNKNALFEYYKLQHDEAHASHVGTTHIRQIAKSYTHSVVITLNGGIIRNNTNVILEAAGNEAHLYGLYLLKGNTHVDNHTLVDNAQPNCLSNELYKGIIDEKATGVFNGKIFVRSNAQKTNAYQSNKNILLGDNATVNSKPQLEIFADDVKCSHGCTVGHLDEEAMFYLRTRGISKEKAQAMLLQAFAADMIEQIKIEPLRRYVEQLVINRLS
jgi:Fe-S cluster assembly protein SufD